MLNTESSHDCKDSSSLLCGYLTFCLSEEQKNVKVSSRESEIETMKILKVMI